MELLLRNHDSHRESKNFVYIIWNLKVRCSAHDSSPLDPVMHHINSIHTIISSLKINFNIIPQSMHVAQIIHPLQDFQLIFCMYFSSVPYMLYAPPNPFLCDFILTSVQYKFPRMKAGYNISTAGLRVVGGDKKGTRCLRI
jgi:hypothetical protein